MGNFDQLNTTGKNIMDHVTEAINSNDYSKLSQNIQTEFSGLTKELEAYYKKQQREATSKSGKAAAAGQQGMYKRQINLSKGTPFNRTNPRNANAIFKIVFGLFWVFALSFFGIGIMALLPVFGSDMYLFNVIFLFAAIAGGGVLTWSGLKDKNLISKFYKYARLCGYEDYISIKKLAKVAGESEKDVVKSIEKMIKKGYLPQAKFDAGKKTLMLSDDVYNAYLEREEQKIEEEQVIQANEEDIDNLNASPEVKKTIREGQSFIACLKTANDEIPDEEMSKKLSKLQALVEKIFDRVKKQPSSAELLNRMMTYYIPTTKKLINAYIDLDKQPVSSKNIAETKKEIEGAIDTVNEAFETLFDSLFRDVAWDISSEVSAMKSMLAQDGLADPQYNNIRKTTSERVTEMAEDLGALKAEETVKKTQ